jgi:hypothetical protein
MPDFSGLSDAIHTFWIVAVISSLISLVYWLVVATYWGRTAANTERCVKLFERVVVLLESRIRPLPSNPTSKEPLNCSSCGYSLSPNVTICWKCGTQTPIVAS